MSYITSIRLSNSVLDWVLTRKGDVLHVTFFGSLDCNAHYKFHELIMTLKDHTKKATICFLDVTNLEKMTMHGAILILALHRMLNPIRLELVCTNQMMIGLLVKIDAKLPILSAQPNNCTQSKL